MLGLDADQDPALHGALRMMGGTLVIGTDQVFGWIEVPSRRVGGFGRDFDLSFIRVVLEVQAPAVQEPVQLQELPEDPEADPFFDALDAIDEEGSP
jgi:hypothetical protein